MCWPVAWSLRCTTQGKLLCSVQKALVAHRAVLTLAADTALSGSTCLEQSEPSDMDAVLMPLTRGDVVGTAPVAASEPLAGERVEGVPARAAAPVGCPREGC